MCRIVWSTAHSLQQWAPEGNQQKQEKKVKNQVPFPRRPRWFNVQTFKTNTMTDSINQLFRKKSRQPTEVHANHIESTRTKHEKKPEKKQEQTHKKNTKRSRNEPQKNTTKSRNKPQKTREKSRSKPQKPREPQRKHEKMHEQPQKNTRERHQQTKKTRERAKGVYKRKKNTEFHQCKRRFDTQTQTQRIVNVNMQK